MISPLLVVLAIVALQRVAELVYASRNARALRAAGAVEIAPQQHGFFVALHAAWLLSMLLTIPISTIPNWPLLAFFFVLQAARVWVIATLGRFWTTRILTLPGAPLVRRGPYRFVRHPNYVIVALEIAALPLAFHQPVLAAAFTLLNGALLAWRISREDRGLAQRRGL